MAYQLTFLQLELRCINTRRVNLAVATHVT